MNESDWIDKFLLDIRTGDYIFLGEESPDVNRKALYKALAYGLLIRDRMNFELTEKGYQSLEAGGFDKWKRAKEKRENEAHQAIVDSTKAAQVSARSAARSFRLAVIVAVISVIPIGLSFWQFFDSRTKDEKISLLETRITSLEEKIKSVNMSTQSQGPAQRKTRAALR